jgi:hypothetical protein
MRCRCRARPFSAWQSVRFLMTQNLACRTRISQYLTHRTHPPRAFSLHPAFTIQNVRKGQSPPPGYLSVFAWDVIVLMEPMSLLGTCFGVRINKMCPQWFIVALMVVTLTYSAVETWKKAVKKSAEERKREQARLQQADDAAHASAVKSPLAPALHGGGGPSSSSAAAAVSASSMLTFTLPPPSHGKSPLFQAASPTLASSRVSVASSAASSSSSAALTESSLQSRSAKSPPWSQSASSHMPNVELTPTKFNADGSYIAPGTGRPQQQLVPHVHSVSVNSMSDAWYVCARLALPDRSRLFYYGMFLYRAYVLSALFVEDAYFLSFALL